MSAATEFDKINSRLSKLELEFEILGHILNIIEDQSEILTELKGEHFFEKANKLLFNLMQKLHQTSHDLTYETINSFIDLQNGSLSDHSQMRDVLRKIKSQKLGESVFNSISLLKELTRNRNIYSEILIHGHIMFQNNEPIEEIISHMSKVLGTIDTGKKEIPIYQVADNVVDSIIDPSLVIPGLLTGIDEFDLLTGGIKEDRYYAIGGESGGGKTAVIIDLIDRLCERYSEQIAVLFFSLEMSEKRVVRRLISRQTNMTEQQLEGRLRHLNSTQKTAVREAGAKIKTYPLEIVYQSMDSNQINMRMRKFALKNQGKRLLVFLDHIGLVFGSTKDPRLNTIEASTTMKSFCRDYNGSVFILTQFTKEIDSNENKKNYHKPHMGYIMESGRIRQDADFIGLIWRPETRFKTIAYDENDQWDTTGKIIILNEKNRDGQCPTDMILKHNVACNRLINSVDVFN